MVQVIAIHTRTNKENKSFVVLEVHGDMELTQSSLNGKFYATAKKCFIPSTFPEDVAQGFIGRKIPGEIIRVECDPYNFKIPSTGEIITLNYSYQYRPVEEGVKKGENKSQSVTIPA